MKTFEESDLIFSFDRSWVVKKYDSHRYYKGLSGVGLKGVDFIALNIKENLAVFFEVKNYRTRYHRDTGKPIRPIPKPPEALAQSLSDKVSDTLSAVDAVITYYRKSFLYRWFLPFIIRSPFYHYDRFFWTKVGRCIRDHHQLQVILWVELEEVDNVYFKCLADLVNDLLGDEKIIVSLADSRSHPFSNSMFVDYSVS
ncbi:MAG: hypothetical protein R2828_11320 [Saprospiraceae bacterium]